MTLASAAAQMTGRMVGRRRTASGRRGEGCASDLACRTVAMVDLRLVGRRSSRQVGQQVAFSASVDAVASRRRARQESGLWLGWPLARHAPALAR